MQRMIKFFMMIMVAGLLSSCATVFGDHGRQVSVTSTPSGARVYVNTVYQGTTPTNVIIRSLWSTNIIQVQKPGYAPISVPVDTSFQPITILDVLFWPTFFVDIATGDVMKISSESRNVHVNLMNHGY